MHPDVSAARARVAALARCVRSGERNPEELDEARRDLTEANVRAYVKKALAQRPPLTDEQRNRLAELLRPVRTGGAR